MHPEGSRQSLSKQNPPWRGQEEVYARPMNVGTGRLGIWDQKAARRPARAKECFQVGVQRVSGRVFAIRYTHVVFSPTPCQPPPEKSARVTLSPGARQTFPVVPEVIYAMPDTMLPRW